MVSPDPQTPCHRHSLPQGFKESASKARHGFDPDVQFRLLQESGSRKTNLAKTVCAECNCTVASVSERQHPDFCEASVVARKGKL